MPKGYSIFYSQDMLEWIKNNVYGCCYAKLTENFNNKFDTDYRVENLRALCKRKKWNNGFSGKFEKKHIPFNKGKKMSEEVRQKVSLTMFKKGNIPHNHRPIGSERITRDGYIEVKTKEPNCWKLKHMVEWEKYNLPINTKKECIIMLDGNRKNCHLDNLRKITRKQNAGMSRYRLWQKEKTLNETALNIVDLLCKCREKLDESNRERIR